MTAPLERSYRMLLFAYPGRYRRRYGPEIVTTLMDLSAPRQRRPRVGDAVHLLGSGLRQRFRLPAGRPLAVLGAVLTALILSALGAAVGSLLAAPTFGHLPDQAGATSLIRLVTGAEPANPPEIYGSAWSGQQELFGSTLAPGWTADAAQARLRAAGWAVGTVQIVDSMPDDPYFLATKDKIEITVRGDTAGATVSGWSLPAPVYRPLVTAGALAGLATGWLLAAAWAHRIRAARRRTAATWLSGLAVSLALPPSAALLDKLVAVYRHGNDGPIPIIHGVLTVHSDYSSLRLDPFLAILLLAAAAVVASTALVLSRPGPRTAENRVVG